MAFFTIHSEGQAPRTINIEGRDRWAMERLIRAGEAGCTPITEPGPRWSGYVHNLRKKGVEIETVHEAHGGPFPGTHARYVLKDRVEYRGATQ